MNGWLWFAGATLAGVYLWSLRYYQWNRRGKLRLGSRLLRALPIPPIESRSHRKAQAAWRSGGAR